MAWKKEKLKTLIEHKSGYTWSKEQETKFPEPKTVRVLTVTNVQKELDLSSELYLKDVSEVDKVKKAVSKDWSIAVSSNGNRSRIGNAVYIKEDSEYLFASFLTAFKPKKDSDILPDYFFRWLTSHNIQERITAVSEGTTGLGNLDIRFLRNTEIEYPENPAEQTAIATILSKVDEAIAATQNSIKAAEKLKKALMQNLLIGKLKPDGSWRSEDEFYEDEKFGKVPKGWEVKKGKKIFKSYGSSSFDNINLSNQGDCIYMKVSDFSLEGNELYIEKANIMFSYENNEELKYCEPDYIVMSKRGEAIRKNRVRILAKRTLLDPNLMALKIIDGNPLFFKFLLEQMNLQRFLENSALPQLNNKDFYPRFYLYPPIEEQEEISNVLLNQHNLKRQKHFKIQNLQRLKKSLMQNLLTGKLRLPQEFIAQFEEVEETIKS